jgi:prepilin-type N-terminal cleavage/methylation domain-containing protein
MEMEWVDKKRHSQGFTLIEVIAVLVLIGILAAVAVPKFFAMQEETERKSLEVALTDMRSRAILAYAKSMLENNGSADPNDYDTFADVGISATADLDDAYRNFAGTWGAVTGTTVKYTMANGSTGATVATFTWTPGDADNPSTIAISYGAT